MRRIILAVLTGICGAACAGAQTSEPPPQQAPLAAAPTASSAAPQTPASGVLTPQAPPTGIEECDRYLEALRQCEPRLADAIARGEQTSYRAEHERLSYYAQSNAEPALPKVCEQMLQALRAQCP